MSDVGHFTLFLSLSAADLEHVDGDSGADFLLSQLHAVEENLEELLRLLLLVELAVEGVLQKKRKGGGETGWVE